MLVWGCDSRFLTPKRPLGGVFSDLPVVFERQVLYFQLFIRLAVAQAEGPNHQAALAGLGIGSR
jgi:hypothetical protein